MKKFIYVVLISIFILGISSTCFAAQGFTKSEFEKLMESFGYGEINLDEYTSETSSLTLDSVLNTISNTKYNLIIMRWGSNKTTEGYNNTQFAIRRENYASTFTENSSGYYSISYTMAGSGITIFDTANKTFKRQSSTSSDSLVAPYDFWKENANVSEADWSSEAYQKFLAQSFFLYNENDVVGTNGTVLMSHQGGKITNSSYEDITYNGSISYSATTETASISYTSGFDSASSYDLFLEQYRLDNDLDYGINYYATDTINLGVVTTTDTLVNVSANKFMDSSYYVYRLCVGKNNFGTTGVNDVYLCTNWLLPNDNTVRAFMNFSRSHNLQLLSLVDYDINYQEPSLDEVVTPDNVEVLIYIYGGNVLNGYISDVNTVDVNIKRRNTSIDIEDYYLILDIYDYETNEKIESIEFLSSSDVSIWGNPIDDENLIFYVLFSELYEFDASASCYYNLRLHSYTSGYVDQTGAFWFNPSYYPGSDGGDEFSFLTNFVQSNFSFVTNIRNSITSFEDVLLGIEPAPSVHINVGATKYTEAMSIPIINLEWYVPYKEFGDKILTGFIYVVFLWQTFTHLPNIINGIGGGVESINYTNDINAFVNTGFGRGDGKSHQNLKRK